jgi:hypothetical protein
MKPLLTKSILIITLLLFSHVLWGQTTMTVKGTIMAFETYPLNNVTVRSLKTGNLTNSDSSGYFSLNGISNDVLLFSAAGFVKRKVRVKGFHQIRVELLYAYTGNSFNEAVSNNHISASLLEQCLSKYPDKNQKDYSKYSTIYELVQHEFFTLKVIGTEIHNPKSMTTETSKEVLYVVDDKVVYDVDFVSPSEIKSIKFIENAETSIYGIGGANGVLKITLKTIK